MAIFTLPELDAQMTAWKAALFACAKNQSYEIEGRTLTRADLPEIRKTLSWLDDERRTLLGQSGPFLLPASPRRQP